MKTFDLADSFKPAGHLIKRITKKVLKISILLIIYFALAFSGGTLAMMVGYIQEAPPFDPANLKTPETSFLYDREGENITRFSGEQNRVVLELNEIPEQVQEAFIVMEDERFFKHIGVDGTAIVSEVKDILVSLPEYESGKEAYDAI